MKTKVTDNKKPRDSAETRRRLLNAAIAEFAAHGVAGGRVDRIAAAANCNKQAIYAYFGSKQDLFNAAHESMADRMGMDAEDLPGSAGRLFDYHMEFPELARITSWYHLERSRNSLLPNRASQKLLTDVEHVREMQARGLVNDKMRAEYIVAFIYRLALVGVLGSTEWLHPEQSTDELRASVVEAVRRMVAP